MSLQPQGIRTITTLIALAALGCSSFVQAQDNPYSLEQGFYVGASIGASNTKIDSGNLVNIQKDETGTGAKFFGGYRLNRNLAVELAYVDLGKISISDSSGTMSWKFVTAQVVQTRAKRSKSCALV